MSIWKQAQSPEQINQLLSTSMAGKIGIRFTEVGADFLKATMPLSDYTRQHKNIMHGGANVVLAETLGSMASLFCCDPGYTVVGLEINANHLRAGKAPEVTGIATPFHIGRRTMVWEIKIYNADGKLSCISRLTTAVIEEVHD